MEIYAFSPSGKTKSMRPSCLTTGTIQDEDTPALSADYKLIQSEARNNSLLHANKFPDFDNGTPKSKSGTKPSKKPLAVLTTRDFLNEHESLWPRTREDLQPYVYNSSSIGISNGPMGTSSTF